MTRATTAGATACAVLLMLLSLLGTSPAAASQSLIIGEAEYADGRVHVSGNVTSEGAPVRNVSITGHLAGNSAAVACDHLGRFTLSLPVPDGVSGSVTFTLVFEGRGQISGTQTSLHVHVPRPPEDSSPDERQAETGPTDSPTAEERAATPAPEQVRLAVEASLSRDTSYPGGLLELAGDVASSLGHPMVHVQVDASFEEVQLVDSTAFTGEGGHFVTYVEVPPDALEGERTIHIRVHAGSGYIPATLELPVVIGPVPEVHSPTPEPADATAETVEVAQTEATVMAQEPPTDAPPTVRASFGPGPRMVMTAVVLVGGLALLTMVVLVFRSWGQRRARSTATGTGTGESWLETFGDAPEDNLPAGPRRARDG